ncbi:MAG TPA: glycosyltransferase family 9 protein [Flavitalea sp.]|nr:glycosyltransferase family 9 protein [Flavitalea sp.]
MKFLVIRFSSIGDIVLASPVFRCLKNQVATAEIHLLTKHSFKAVTEANPYIDKFYYLERSIDDVIHSLLNEDYDYVIDLHNNFRSQKIRRALKKPTQVIDKLNWQKFLLTNLHVNFMPRRHITTRSLDTVGVFGVNDDGKGLDYFIPEKDRIRDEDLPTSHHAGYIAIVIGASYLTKKLPVYKLKQLCSTIQYPIVLVGGKEDAEEGQAVSSVDSSKIYNACGKFNLNESADIVRRSNLVISHDTGLQYIACAFGKKVLALWGSTSPKLDVEPYYGSALANDEPGGRYENIFLDLPCQPCSKFGNKKCPRGHFKCMREQNIEVIAEKALARL